MEPASTKPPFYIRLSYILLCLLMISYILYNGRDIVIPLVFSILLSVFLLPVVEFLGKRKWFPRPLAILLPLFIAMAGIAGILYFISSQASLFAEDLPALKERFTELLGNVQTWIRQNINVSLRDQNEYVSEMMERFRDSGVVGKTFLSITSNLSLIVLIPIFTFLLLFYKELILTFFFDVFQQKDEGKVKDVFHESRSIVQSYLTGLVIELVIVIILNIIGLSLLGIKYAVLLGVMAGVLNLIPYIGMISATFFIMTVTLITSDNTLDVLWVMVTLGSIQFVDNYLLMPAIVGRKVQINALATILGVLVGGTLMGVAGMFLSIPAIAVIKVICDRVNGLEPWGALLGNNVEGDKKLAILESLKSKFRRQP